MTSDELHQINWRLAAVRERIERLDLLNALLLPRLIRAALSVAAVKARADALRRKSFWRSATARAIRKGGCGCKSGHSSCACRAGRGVQCRRLATGEIVCVGHGGGVAGPFKSQQEFDEWRRDWGQTPEFRKAYLDGGRIVRG